MATRAKKTPSKATKSQKSAAPRPKTANSVAVREKSAKSGSTPARKTTAKVTKTTKKKKVTPEVEAAVAKMDDVSVLKTQAAPKKRAAKSAAMEDEAKPKTSKRPRKPQTEDALDDAPVVLEFTDSPNGRERKKKTRFIQDDIDDDSNDGEVDEEEEDDEDKDRSLQRRARNGGKKAVKVRKRSATEEFLEEDMEETDDTEEIEILDDLDPFASTLILDPELTGPPPAPIAQLPPRPKRLAPRMQVCADCGQEFGWLSMEKVCFACLKRRVAQRKKDEDYSGYGGSDDSSGDDDY